MTKETKRKIIVITLKSIRVVAWLVASLMAVAGLVLFVSEPDESFGAGMEFTLAMIHKTLVSIGMFLIACGFGCVVSKITNLFKRYGIK